MVLTQQGFEKDGQYSVRPRFHTTMVLTQLAKVLLGLWMHRPFPYHYGSHATVTERFFRKQWYRFPYHYGSHATVSCKWEKKAHTRFHTTMVLTQRVLGVTVEELMEMFPYHYGSHATRFWKRWTVFCPTSFPYHYGSHATCKGSTRTMNAQTVSIPLWFSRNGYGEILPQAVVSVSIPLWFSRNGFVQVRKESTYTFPYHYGSHATGTGRDSRGTDGNVSIPLWFSRNFSAQ